MFALIPYRVRLWLGFPVALWELLVTHLPGDIGTLLRYRYWRRRLKFLGRNVRIDVGVSISDAAFVSIGDNCWIDRNVVIMAGLDASRREKIYRYNRQYHGEPGCVVIGKNVHVGAGTILSGISAGISVGNNCCFSAGCRVYAFSHHYRSEANPEDTRFGFGSMVPEEFQCLIEGAVTIGDNTGIALGATILPGTAIAKNSFVGVGCVVSGKSFEPNSRIDGNPGCYIGPRFGRCNK